MNDTKKRILIADDEEGIRFTFGEFLAEAGYLVETAHSLSNCITKMQSEPFDLLFLDVLFGVENGIEAIERLKVLQPGCEIVVMTGNPDVGALLESKKKGAFDYLAKPVRKASLLYHVQKVFQNRQKTQ